MKVILIAFGIIAVVAGVAGICKELPFFNSLAWVICGLVMVRMGGTMKPKETS